MLGRSLVDQVAALSGREISSTELVEASLKAIESVEPELNAFKLLRGEEALAEAAAADRELAGAGGEPAEGGRRPLLGVPVAIKDDTDLAGYPTAFGTELELPPLADDAELVRRLKAAGAIIVGKTNTPEFGQWPITEGPGFGKQAPSSSARPTRRSSALALCAQIACVDRRAIPSISN